MTASATNNGRIQFFLFGHFRAAVNDQPVEEKLWVNRKAKVLCQILALQPQMRMHCEQLTALLFPDQETDQAAANLSRLQYYARQVFHSDEKNRRLNFFVRQDQTLKLIDDENAIWVDVNEFRRLSIPALRKKDVKALERAANLYQGDLLVEELYTDWAMQPRESLREIYLKVLRQLIEILWEQQPAAAAANWVDKLLAAEPIEEAAHRQKMQLLAMNGQRTQAIRHYNLCREVLKKELGVEPETATIRLRDQIADGKISNFAVKTRRAIAAEIISADSEAERCILRGRFLLGKRDPNYLKDALACFRQAAECDERCASAFAGIAQVHNLFSIYGVEATAESLRCVTHAAHSALALDESHVEARLSLAHARCVCQWQLKVGGSEIESLRRQSPDNALVRQWYGEWLSLAGDFRAAVAEAKIAADLAPVSISANNAVGHSYFYAQDYLPAVEKYAETLELDNNCAKTHFYLGQALREADNFPAAIKHFRCAVRLNQNDFHDYAALAHALAVTGETQKAEAMLSRLLTRKNKNVSPYHLAIVYLGLDQKTFALDYLQKAHADRCGLLIYAPINPLFKNLKREPRFQKLCGNLRIN